MDGIDVYNRVSELESLLSENIEWAEQDCNDGNLGHATDEANQYIAQLKVLNEFLNPKTKKRLTFKTNTLNIIFQKNTIENVEIIYDMLQEISQYRPRVTAVIESLPLPTGQKNRLQSELSELHATLSKYTQELKIKLEQKGLIKVADTVTERERHSTLESVDLLDVHKFNEKRDILTDKSTSKIFSSFAYLKLRLRSGRSDPKNSNSTPKSRNKTHPKGPA